MHLTVALSEPDEIEAMHAARKRCNAEGYELLGPAEHLGPVEMPEHPDAVFYGYRFNTNRPDDQDPA
jgi:hypothetical protein